MTEQTNTKRIDRLQERYKALRKHTDGVERFWGWATLVDLVLTVIALVLIGLHIGGVI